MFDFDSLGYLFILEILSLTKAFKFEKSAVLSLCPAFWYTVNENTELIQTSKNQLVIGCRTFQSYMLLVAVPVQPYILMVAGPAQPYMLMIAGPVQPYILMVARPVQP
jgi:hypothetical protein